MYLRIAKLQSLLPSCAAEYDAKLERASPIYPNLMPFDTLIVTGACLAVLDLPVNSIKYLHRRVCACCAQLS